jgi:hypothetical protein
MRQYPQWFIYRLHDRDPATCKYKKQPIDPRTRAKPLEAHGGINQCTDFETVARVGAEMQAAAKPGERYVPGFYFTENDPFAFFDIDKCVVTVDGNTAWSPLALELLGLFARAARETSSSGRGWHVIATTTVPPSKGRKNGECDLEFYARDRGAALTFENVSGNAGADETQAFEAIRARYFPAKAVDESAEWTDFPVRSVAERDLAKAAEVYKLENRVFADLVDGKTDRYKSKSASEVDFGFAKDLLRLSGWNCEAVLEYMQGVGLALRRAKWTEGYLRETILNAYREIAASPIDNPKFDAPLPPGASLTPIRPAPSERFPIYTFDELVARPPLQWVVKGVMPADGVAAMFGPAGSGKSFLLFDMLAAIATGAAWFERRCKKSPVLYVALEGAAGFAQRAAAYAKRFGVKPAMLFVTAPLDICKPDDVALLVEAIRAKGWPGNGVIAVDTLNAAMPGRDENGPQDMGAAIAGLKAVQRAFGGLAIVVHHVGKDASKGLRGHSSLHGALDAAIEVTREGLAALRTWNTAKLKDGADGEGPSFTLESVYLGNDADGEPITSCVIARGAAPAPGESGAAGTPTGRLGKNQRVALEILNTLLSEPSALTGLPDSVPKLRPAIAWEVAKQAVGKDYQLEERRKWPEAHRVIQSLIKTGWLSTDGQYLWRTLYHEPPAARILPQQAAPL